MVKDASEQDDGIVEEVPAVQEDAATVLEALDFSEYPDVNQNLWFDEKLVSV